MEKHPEFTKLYRLDEEYYCTSHYFTNKCFKNTDLKPSNYFSILTLKTILLYNYLRTETCPAKYLIKGDKSYI
jgi:hypothetical protein